MPSANPSRTNTPREPTPQRTRSSVDLASYTERAGEQPRAHDRETTKLNQIIQHFHSKAALMICSARATLPPAYTKSGEVKQNRWFNTVLDETDVLQDALQEWKRPDLPENRPPPLVIEVYVDTSHLRENQALVMVDDTGKRWDVSDALVGSADSSPRPQNKSGRKHYEVMLERWTIELGDAAGYSAAALNDQLPNVYKKGVVLFRSLYTFLRFLPAWRLHRRLGRQPGKHQALRLKYRIREGARRSSPQGQKDALATPLCPPDTHNTSTTSNKITERHALQPLLCPAGLLRVELDYRINQELDTVDVEALLSSRLGTTNTASPSPPGPYHSLPATGAHTTHRTTTTSTPPHQQRQDEEDEDDIMPPNWHPEGRWLTDAEGNKIEKQRRKSFGLEGKSPFTHGSFGDSPDMPLKQKIGMEQAARGNYQYQDTLKAPKWAKEVKRQQDSVQVHAAEPLFRPSTFNSQLRRVDTFGQTTPQLPAGPMRFTPPAGSNRLKAPPRSSSAAQQVQQMGTLIEEARGAPPALRQPVASSAPVTEKYTSSFAGRTKRPTSLTSHNTNRSNRSNDSGGSSARGSASEHGTKSDEEEIAAFVGQLAAASKNHPLARPSTQRYEIGLDKYRSLRDPSTNLAEDMASSSLLSTTPQSRRLSNVPGLSTSSSPRAHAPHVRSRLSTNSIVEEGAGSLGGSSGAARPDAEGAEEEDEPFLFAQEM
ncbi:hypothetical protein LTR08_004647 [Meristemomyces frigidus]|nr:hypothetical protein LTR08_004647 [Meristemomyces frigidus]